VTVEGGSNQGSGTDKAQRRWEKWGSYEQPGRTTQAVSDAPRISSLSNAQVNLPPPPPTPLSQTHTLMVNAVNMWWRRGVLTDIEWTQIVVKGVIVLGDGHHSVALTSRGDGKYLVACTLTTFTAAVYTACRLCAALLFGLYSALIGCWVGNV